MTQPQPSESETPDAPAADAVTWRRFDVGAAPEEALDAARAAIKAGACIVMPTDTVYGIAANAFSAAAVQSLLDAKERGRDMPPPVLIAEPAVRVALARDGGDYAERLADAFWPGALTLIFDKQPSLRVDLGEMADTIALRVPDHDFARTVLRRTGPLAVSSANISGEPAALTVDDAIAQLGNKVAVYLDAGPMQGAVPSTIVDFSQSHYGEVLRHGVLTTAELREVDPFLQDPNEDDAQPDEAVEPAPGSVSHDDEPSDVVEPAPGSVSHDDEPSDVDLSAVHVDDERAGESGR